MSKWIMLTWVLVVPWYLLTGATGGPSGVFGSQGPWGIVGFHAFSAALAILSLWALLRWHRTIPQRSFAGTALAVTATALAVTAVAHAANGVAAAIAGGSESVFETTSWRTGAVAALVCTPVIMLGLIGATIASVVSRRRGARSA